MSPAGIAALLRLLEAPGLQFPHSQIVDHLGPAGEALIAAGLLVPDGFVHSAAAPDDEDGSVLAVTRDGRHPGLGFHHPAQGWVEVRQDTLQRFRLDLGATFGQMLGSQLLVPPHGMVEREAGLVWHLGSMRLLRLGLTEVWFARRLGTATGSAALAKAVSRQPPSSPRLVLTGTSHGRLTAAMPAMLRVVPIADVLSLQDPATIDTAQLQARFAGQVAEAVTGPLHLSADGRMLTVNGVTTITFRGTVQIAVIRAVVEAHHAGQRVRAAQVLAQAQSQTRTFAQAFGPQWSVLRRHLVSRDGSWGFEL